MKNSQWIDGPQFLWKTKCIETEELNDISIPEDDPEVKQVTAAACQIQAEPSYDLHPIRKLINYYSTWRKLTRAVAWLLRFKSYLRGQIEFLPDARLRELSEAEFVILQHEQDYSFGRDKVHLTTGPGMVRKGSDLVRLDPIMFKGTYLASWRSAAKFRTM